MTEQRVKTAEKLVGQKLEQYKIEKEQPNKPTIKIIGIDDNYFYLNDKELESDINNRNFVNLESKGKILHIYYNTKTGKQTVTMNVTAEIHKNIKEYKRIYKNIKE